MFIASLRLSISRSIAFMEYPMKRFQAFLFPHFPRIRNSIAALLLLAILLVLPSFSDAHGGEEHSSDGEIEVTAIDYLEQGRSDIRYFYIPDKTKERHELQFENRAPEGLVSGQRVKIRRGKRYGNTIVAAANDGSFQAQEAASAAVSGPRSALIVRSNMTDRSVPCSDSQLAGVMWNNAESNNTVYQRSSFGLVNFPSDSNGDGEPDIVTVQTGITYDGGCSYSTWKSAAKQALSAQGIDTSSYDHLVFVLPRVDGCGWAGVGWINHPDSMINGKWCSWMTVYPHELGHNIGLAHAGNGSAEYGDHSSFMGNPSTSPLANAANTAQQEWIGSRMLDTGAGSYSLSPLYTAGATQVLRVEKPDTSEYYYVSYRHASGDDAKLGSAYSDKVSVHKYRGSGYSASTLLTTLAAGEVYTDATNGISIRVDAITSGSSAEVTIGAECAVSAPAVSLSPSSQYTGTAGASLDYTLSVTNNDSNCNPAVFDLTASTTPAGFAASLSSSTMTLASGESGAVTVSVASNVDTVNGSYAFSISIADESHPTATADAFYVLDLNAPAPITDLTATANRKNKVSLSWSTPSDSGGSGFSHTVIYRNGVQIGTTSASSYTDSGTSSATTYDYQVVAVDFAGNRSGASNTATVTTGTKGGGSNGSGGGGNGGGGNGGGKGNGRNK